jgi:hypothetical protein
VHEMIVGVGVDFRVGEREEEGNREDDGGRGGASRGEGRLCAC